MHTEPPYRGRAIVETLGTTTRVTIPAPKRAAVAFLILWICGWAFGEVTVIRQILFRHHPPGRHAPQEPFLFVWLAMWTVGGALALFTVLWTLFGRERITVADQFLTIRREVLGVGREKRYDLATVKDLRVTPVAQDVWQVNGQRWGFSGGIIAFDYGARTIRFGAPLDEAEAKQITATLIQNSSWLRRSRTGSAPPAG
jgi:hypothetical protein